MFSRIRTYRVTNNTAVKNLCFRFSRCYWLSLCKRFLSFILIRGNLCDGMTIYIEKRLRSISCSRMYISNLFVDKKKFAYLSISKHFFLPNSWRQISPVQFWPKTKDAGDDNTNEKVENEAIVRKIDFLLHQQISLKAQGYKGMDESLVCDYFAYTVSILDYHRFTLYVLFPRCAAHCMSSKYVWNWRQSKINMCAPICHLGVGATGFPLKLLQGT